MQRGWYDRKLRQVRNLGCGGLRIYLEPEVRRVACCCCRKSAPNHPHDSTKSPFFDRTGGYGPAWVGSAALNVVALGLLAWARPPRRLEPSLKEA